MQESLTTAQAMDLLQQGCKVRGADWMEGAFIRYCPINGVLDEYGNEVSACVLLVNSEWLKFTD